MADGPTVNQVLKQRDAALATCDTKATAERATIDGSITYGLSLRDYAKELLAFGPELKSVLQFRLKSAENLCTFTARIKADSQLTVREAHLEAEKLPLEGIIKGQKIAYEGMRKLAHDSIQRAKVAEALCANASEPDPGRPQSPKLLLAKK